jgi:hypothetical protein
VYQEVTVGELPVRSKEAPFPWENIFVSAYGAGMRTRGSSDFGEYVAVDAVYPLFNYDVSLQNPELAFRRLTMPRHDTPESMLDYEHQNRHTDEMSNYIMDILRHVLSLNPDDDIVLTNTGLEIKRGDDYFELSSQGDGHQATTTWILDLLSWWMIYLKLNHAQTSIQQKQVRGIVLIDEIEQHLHPRWQIKIMELIRDKFPHVQFITSTHSPLVLSGCDNMAIHSLYNGKHKITRAHGWLAEDVYELMGLRSTRSPSFRSETLEQYARLDEKQLQKKELTPTESEKLREITERLRFLPGNDPLRLKIKLDNIRKLLTDSRSTKDDEECS